MIKNIQLVNFRNYAGENVDFSAGKNVFTGGNGEGKSNLLEALYFLANLRSFRTVRLADLARMGSEGFALNAEIAVSGIDWPLKLRADYRDGRQLFIDDGRVGRSSDFIRFLKTVVFSPDDIQLVNGPALGRRRFLDMFVAALEPPHINSLFEYNMALKSRNHLFKEDCRDENMFMAYEAILAEQSCLIAAARQHYCHKLSQELRSVGGELAPDYTIAISYRFLPEYESSELYLKKLERERESERKKFCTQFGVHLDDPEITFDKVSARKYASNGQRRLIALCLKLAKINILSEYSPEETIALIDDVFGELDDKARAFFFSCIESTRQQFFTFTQMPQHKYFSDSRQFEILQGKIKKL